MLEVAEERWEAVRWVRRSAVGESIVGGVEESVEYGGGQRVDYRAAIA
jgi:hypothetical protein